MNAQGHPGLRWALAGAAFAAIVAAAPMAAAAEDAPADSTARVERDQRPRFAFLRWAARKPVQPEPAPLADSQSGVALNPLLVHPLEMPVGKRRQRFIPIRG